MFRRDSGGGGGALRTRFALFAVARCFCRLTMRAGRAQTKREDVRRGRSVSSGGCGGGGGGSGGEQQAPSDKQRAAAAAAAAAQLLERPRRRCRRPERRRRAPRVASLSVYVRKF